MGEPPAAAPRVVLGLISDTHGRLSWDRLMPQLRRAFDGVDAIWHAGDWDDPRILEELHLLGPPVVAVGGNVGGSGMAMVHSEELAGRRVGMVHILEEADPLWLRGLDLVVHGHSHRFADRQLPAGVRAINPGTATAPRFGSRDRTVARLVLGHDVRLERVDLLT